MGSIVQRLNAVSNSFTWIYSIPCYYFPPSLKEKGADLIIIIIFFIQMIAWEEPRGSRALCWLCYSLTAFVTLGNSLNINILGLCDKQRVNN